MSGGYHSQAQRTLMPRMRGLPRLQATSSPGYAVLLISNAYAPSRCLDTSMINCALTAAGQLQLLLPVAVAMSSAHVINGAPCASTLGNDAILHEG